MNHAKAKKAYKSVCVFSIYTLCLLISIFSDVNAANRTHTPCHTCSTEDKPCPRCYPTSKINAIHPCRYGNGCPKSCVVSYWSNRIHCVRECYPDSIIK